MAAEHPLGDIPAMQQDQVPPQVIPPQNVPPQVVPPQAVPPQVVPPQAVPPQAVPPQLPPRPQRVNPGLQLIRTPPILKLSMDLDTYLRRFQAYTNSIGATPVEIPHLLINSLDDETLQYIERHLVDDITLPELIAVLRREMGISRLNREDYKAKLRKTLRGRNEEVRSYYSKLWNLAKRAWPDNVEVRNSNLRDVFIGNIQDSGISARLRERPELNNEQILDLAVTLLNCKNASLSRQSEVNAAFGPQSAFEQALDTEPPVRPLSAPSPSIEQKLDQVIGLLANTTVDTSVDRNSQPSSRYQYTGDRRSVGLNTYNRGYQYPRHQGPRNNYRFNFNSRYTSSPSRHNFQYNQNRTPNRYQRDFRNNGPRSNEPWNRSNNFYPRGRNF
jgi:hypothetical protein